MRHLEKLGFQKKMLVWLPKLCRQKVWQLSEKALNVVKAVVQKALNESDNTLSIDVFTGLQKVEHISGKKIPETKLYHVNKALREGITPENIISNNPELFEPK